MSTKVVKLSDFKAKQYQTNQALDSLGSVELKEVFFDSITWTTEKALLLRKGDKTAWVARSVIESVDLVENEPSSMWFFNWVIINWQGENK